MLTRTFQQVPGVGAAREKQFWDQGVLTWNDFEAAKPPGLILEPIRASQKALEAQDLEKLGQLVPHREHWRLYPEFAHDVLFFDIETDENQTPTVVSLFDGQAFEVFVAGKNLEQLPRAMAQKRFWVTFGGAAFDVPVLTKHFPNFEKPFVHLDLRYFCHQLQLRGGLKAIETALGIQRPAHLQGVNGRDAVYLWHAFQHRQDLDALRFLVEYNLYDTVFLKSVLERSFNEAVRQLNFETPQLAVSEMNEIEGKIRLQIQALGGEARDLGILSRIRAQSA